MLSLQGLNKKKESLWYTTSPNRLRNIPKISRKIFCESVNEIQTVTKEVGIKKVLQNNYAGVEKKIRTYF